MTLTTTDGTLYAVGDTPQNGGLTLVVTSDNNGCASAMLQSSTTPNVETITGSYTDASSTLHTGTATVTFFQPYLQSSGVSAPGPLATPLFAAAVGNATDTVSVTLTSNPPIDLTQVTVTWDPNSDGALDTTDPTGATWLLSRAPAAKNLDNVSVSVQASVTTTSCPAQIAILRVTGIAPATSDASGLFAADSTGHNLVTGVQSGVSATVQASVQPALSALQPVYNQFLFWNQGTPCAGSADCCCLSCTGPSQTMLSVFCGASSASATVWVASVDLEIAGVPSVAEEPPRSPWCPRMRRRELSRCPAATTA